MSDEVEKKIENPPAARSLEEIVRASQFTDKNKQNSWSEATVDYRTTQKDSATMEALSDARIAEIKAAGGFQKFELFDSTAEASPSDQVLIASSIVPNVPNLEQKHQYQDIQSDSQQPKIAQYSDSYMPPPTLVPSFEQLGLDQIWHGLAELQHHVKHQFRGHIGETMNAIPDHAWSDAYNKFPQFQEVGMTEKQATELMQAIARNELFFYDLGDALDDKSMRETGKPMQYPFKDRPAGAATLGVSQVSLDGVKKFEGEFPSQMAQYAGHEAEALLDPRQAPMIIAAVLAHNIRDYKGHYAINERTLAYSFNPDVPGEKGKKLPTDETLKESEHYANVMRQLAIIRGQVLPKPDEQ
ncbi:MAG: hypothetical protein HYX67_11080 [Candidatus Melainabacteria bacterium]|nr:hypothetical protein [Candidatus Melainabacteria bacterium]